MKEYEVLWRTRYDTLVLVEVRHVTANSHASAAMKILDESGFRPEQIEIIRVEEQQC